MIIKAADYRTKRLGCAKYSRKKKSLCQSAVVRCKNKSRLYVLHKKERQSEKVRCCPLQK